MCVSSLKGNTIRTGTQNVGWGLWGRLTVSASHVTLKPTLLTDSFVTEPVVTAMPHQENVRLAVPADLTTAS